METCAGVAKWTREALDFRFGCPAEQLQGSARFGYNGIIWAAASYDVFFRMWPVHVL